MSVKIQPCNCWYYDIIITFYVKNRPGADFCLSNMPRSHIHGSPRRFICGLNLTDDPGNANFRSTIRMHYIRMIKYYNIWLRMQYRKLRTNMDCHECFRIVSVANPASSPYMCDLGLSIWTGTTYLPDQAWLKKLNPEVFCDIAMFCRRQSWYIHYVT